MSRLRQKLRSRTGETLTETLCALVIIVLSSAMLAGMVFTAVHFNKTALAEEQKRATEQTVAVQQNGAGISGRAGITVTVQGAVPSPLPALPANYYSMGYQGALTSYVYHPGRSS